MKKNTFYLLLLFLPGVLFAQDNMDSDNEIFVKLYNGWRVADVNVGMDKSGLEDKGKEGLSSLTSCNVNKAEYKTFTSGQVWKDNNDFHFNPLDAKNFRYIICTDMTHDDDNSLIRLLHYANEIDIEAIIVTDQGPETQRIENWPNQMWNRVQGIIDAYGQVVDNLKLHDPNFPSADYFRGITKQGKGTAQRLTGSTDNGQERFWDYVGEGRNSEASDFLQEVFDREDDRPIYVGFWGGAITFAQAIWKYQQSHTEEQVQKLMDKLIFHCISFQDVTFDMFVDLDSIGKNLGTGKPFYGNYKEERLIPAMLLADGNNFWNYIGAVHEEKIHEYSGPLGDLYDNGGEGDTPAFLNLISMNLGLTNILKPGYGGWGDMFHAYGLKNVWTANPDEANELVRWMPEASNDFYARCMWEEYSYESCNHAPVAAYSGDYTRNFVHLFAEEGEELMLNANGSMDPDGDELSFKWWHYNTADTFKGQVNIKGMNKKEASLIIPKMDTGQSIHIILEVKDSGKPKLTSYKRVIIKNR